MDNYVFNIPIAAHHPYEQNISDYDDYFLRDLDAIFPQPSADPVGAAETSPVLDFYQQQQQQQSTNSDWDGSLSTPVPADVGDSLHSVEQPWPVDFYFENKIDCQQSSLAENFEHAHTQQAILYNLTDDQEKGKQKRVAYTDALLASNAGTATLLPPIASPENVTPTSQLPTTVCTITSTFRCHICAKSFATKRALTCHKARSSACYSPTSNRCEPCQLSYPTRRDLQTHIRSEHRSRSAAKLLQQPNVPNFACPLCPQSFTTRTARNQHKRTHRAGDLANCNQLPHPQTTSSATKRPLKCELCSRSFHFRTLLNHHRATDHEPQPRYPCQIGFCDQVFATDDLLRRHEQRRHTTQNVAATVGDDNDQPEKLAAQSKDSQSSGGDLAAVALVKSDNCVRCPHAGCRLTFANVVQLRRHQTLHRLRTYRCSQCGREYHSRAVFDTHTRLSHPVEAAMAAAKAAGQQPAPDAGDVVLVADEDHDSGPMECAGCGQLFENRRVLRQHRQFCAEENDDGDVDASGESVEERMEEKTPTAVSGEPLAIEEVYVKQEPIDELPDFVMEE